METLHHSLHLFLNAFKTEVWKTHDCVSLLLSFVRSIGVEKEWCNSKSLVCQLKSRLLLERLTIGCDLSHENVKESLIELLKTRLVSLTELFFSRENLALLNDLLKSISHPQRIRRLHLPWNSSVQQPTLDRFTSLVELNISGCKQLTSVHFCAKSLRILYASFSFPDDAGLSSCKRSFTYKVAAMSQLSNHSHKHCRSSLPRAPAVFLTRVWNTQQGS